MAHERTYGHGSYRRDERAGTAAADRDVLPRVQRLVRGGTPATAPRIRAAGLALLSAHLLFVCWLTLRPLSVPWVAPANLRPLATIRSDLAGDAYGALAGIGGGLALLAPLGVLLPLATGRLHRPVPATWARTVGAGAMVSLLISLLQSGVPGRVANVDAVLLNTLGVALSCLLFYPPLRRLLRRRVLRADPHGSGGPGSPRGRTPVARRDDAAAGPTRRAPRVGIAP